jgi:prevent-host-death family protein
MLWKGVVAMITIRPVSDLRNRFAEIEKTVKEGTPVYLTKNGYGTMVVMSLEHYAALTEDVEAKLDEADYIAETTTERYTADEVFARVKKRIKSHEEI